MYPPDMIVCISHSTNALEWSMQDKSEINETSGEKSKKQSLVWKEVSSWESNIKGMRLTCKYIWFNGPMSLKKLGSQKKDIIE